MKYHLPLGLPEHFLVSDWKTGWDFNITFAGQIVEKQIQVAELMDPQTQCHFVTTFWSSSLVAPAAAAAHGKAGPFGALPLALWIHSPTVLIQTKITSSMGYISGCGWLELKVEQALISAALPDGW